MTVARASNRASLLYNLACVYALQGKPEKALAHLESSIRLDPKLGAAAQEDLDLASLHDDTEFRMMTRSSA